MRGKVEQAVHQLASCPYSANIIIPAQNRAKKQTPLSGRYPKTVSIHCRLSGVAPPGLEPGFKV